MKRIFLLTLVMMLAIVSFSYCQSNNWGNTDTEPLLSKVLPSYQLTAGTSFGGAGTMSSSAVTVISTAYSVISLTVDASVGTVNTLANGTPGQILTVIVVARTSSGTSVITPATKTGFATITTGAVGTYATLLYVDSTVGWIIIGTNCTVA